MEFTRSLIGGSEYLHDVKTSLRNSLKMEDNVDSMRSVMSSAIEKLDFIKNETASIKDIGSEFLYWLLGSYAEAITWPTLLIILVVIHACCFLFGTRNVLRFPIAGILLLILFLEISGYVGVRFAVYLFECFFCSQKHELMDQMKKSTTFEDWEKVAKALDKREGRDLWKEDPHHPQLNHRMLTQKIEALSRTNDVKELLPILLQCMTKNYAGIMSWELYISSYTGTKRIIHEYIDVVLDRLELVEKCSRVTLKPLIRLFVRSAQTSYGQTVLCMSGGAGMGWAHFGLLKALLENKLLPKRLHGTSAGASAAAWVGSRSREQAISELCFDSDREALFQAAGPNGPFFGSGCMSRLWKIWISVTRGFLAETVAFQRAASWFCGGDAMLIHEDITPRQDRMTLHDAHITSGLDISISVTRTSPTLVTENLALSHTSTPNIYLDIAMLASCAIPRFMKPILLYERNSEGKSVRYNMMVFDDVQFRDGTFFGDVQCEDADYKIVSQVNPHITPFFYNNQGAVGKPTSWRKETGGWRGGFFLALLESWIKNDMISKLRMAHDLKILPDVLGISWCYLFLQENQGDLTLVPNFSFYDYFSLMDNIPSKIELHRRIRLMEMQAYQKMTVIKNRLLIEKALARIAASVEK